MMNIRRMKIIPILSILLLTIVCILPLFGCNAFKREGEFITIQEAYERKFYTDANLTDLRDYVKNDLYSYRTDKPTLTAIREAAAYEMRTRKDDPIKNANAEEVVVSIYYEANGCIPVRARHIDSEYPDTEWKFEVAGIEFEYTGPEIRIWKKSDRASGPFYSMQEAYARGFVTVDDVKEIAATYKEKGEKPCLYEEFEDIDKDLKADINADYAKYYNAELYFYYDIFRMLTPDDVFIYNYYGNFKGFAVVTICDNTHGHPGYNPLVRIIEAGVAFDYYNFHQIILYKI